MKTENQNTATTSTSGKSNPTPRTVSAVHAEARELGLDVHQTGEVLHRNVSDVEPMDFVWGCAFGHGLAIDAVHAIRLNTELGFSPDEGIQNLLRDAFGNLDRSTDGQDRRGVAVGVIHTIAALAANTIQRGHALVIAESLQTEAVEFAVSADIEQSMQLKARSMGRRAASTAQEATA